MNYTNLSYQLRVLISLVFVVVFSLHDLTLNGFFLPPICFAASEVSLTPWPFIISYAFKHKQYELITDSIF